MVISLNERMEVFGSGIIGYQSLPTRKSKYQRRLTSSSAGMTLVDFTNPEACKWYKKYLSQLIALGVDSFKTDFGERIPFKNVVYHEGSDPAHMHNYYTFLYNRTVQEVIMEDLGPTKSCLFARSATAGGNNSPCIGVEIVRAPSKLWLRLFVGA